MALVPLAVPADFLLESPSSQPQLQGFPDDFRTAPSFRFHRSVNSLQEGFVNTNRYSLCHAV